MVVGPHGEKRPADPVANALHVAKLLTGEAEEQYVDPARQAGGRKAGRARANARPAEQRWQSAKEAAEARR